MASCDDQERTGDPGNLVEMVACDYFRCSENGDQVVADDFVARLPDERSRSELRQIIGAAQWARERFPAHLRVESRLDQRYRLIREIGAGGFGRVWLAEDELQHRDVAVKIVTVHGSGDKARKSLEKEVHALNRLSHPGIVKLHGSGRHGDCCYLVMEHLRGRSLEDTIAVLARGPLDAASRRRALAIQPTDGGAVLWDDDVCRFAAKIVVGILWALEAAHACGIVHRDLKPSNIMLRTDGHPVLLDFGIAGARDHSDGTITRGLVGSTPYLAPEQLVESRSGKSPSVDLYQVGVVLYELLTHRHAFEAASHEELVRRITNGDLSRPRALNPSIPVALEDIVLKAMEPSVRRRFPNAAAFRVALEQWLNGEGQQPVATLLSRGSRRVRTWIRRHRAATLLAAAMVLGAVPAFLVNRGHLVGDLRIDRDGNVWFDLAEAAMVHSWGFVLDADSNKVVAVVPACFDGDQAPQKRLEPGRYHFVLRAEPSTNRGAPGMKLIVVPRATTNPHESMAWENLRTACLERGGQVQLRELTPIADAVVSTLRGSGSSGSVLENLIGDGTLEGLGLTALTVAPP